MPVIYVKDGHLTVVTSADNPITVIDEDRKESYIVSPEGSQMLMFPERNELERMLVKAREEREPYLDETALQEAEVRITSLEEVIEKQTERLLDFAENNRKLREENETNKQLLNSFRRSTKGD